MTFLSSGLPTAGQSAEACSASLQGLAAKALGPKINMTVAYGGRTGSSGYNATTMAGAVAIFLLAREKHWLFHMPAALTPATAELVLSDFGEPEGKMHMVPAVAGKAGTSAQSHVWRREFERATVELDCGSFTPTFRLKTTDAGPRHRRHRHSLATSERTRAGMAMVF